MEMLLKLPLRLMAIAGFIEKGASVADIGTDHGYLPVYLAQNGLARSIIACDISAGSLETARRSADKYNVSDKITFVVAPGLSGIDEANTDTIVISGLGGETIAAILEASPRTKRGGVTLILQPQSKLNELCLFLRENGYIIQEAKLVCDNNRFYVIIKAGGGKSNCILAPDIELLTQLMFRRDPLFSGYLDRLIAKTRKALEGMGKSGSPDIIGMTVRLATYSGLKESYENANCK